MDNTEALGDKDEKVIKTELPKTYEKHKECKSCKKRKEWLNNINGIFSTSKK